MTDQGTTPSETNEDDTPPIKPWHVVGSVFAAGLGVQSSKNRERDFKQGRFGVFLAVGFLFTLVFIGSVYGVVQLVLKSAGH